MTWAAALEAWAIMAAVLAFNLGLMADHPKSSWTAVKWLGCCALWPFAAVLLILALIAGAGSLVRYSTLPRPKKETTHDDAT